MTRQITPIQLPAGGVIPSDIALADGKILIGGSGGNAVAQTMSGDVTITDTGVATLSSAAAALAPFTGRNKLINGDMRIDQRNAGASAAITTANAYYLDRWAARFMTGTGHTIQQVATAPAGFSSSLLITVGTGGAAPTGDINDVYQPIEGLNCADLNFGAATAAAVTLSFWVRSSLTGQFGGALVNSALNRSYPFTYTINAANTFEKKTITITGDVSGTWLVSNTIGIYVFFDLGVGTTYQGTAGAWAAALSLGATGDTKLVGTSGATFYLSGVQFEKGSIATPFESVDYATMLVRCQRYYTKTFPAATAPAQSAGVGGAITVKNPIALGEPSIWWKFVTSMRANPTIVTYNPSASNANWRDVTASADVTVDVDPATSIGTNGVLIDTSGTVTTLGDILCIHATASAEL